MRHRKFTVGAVGVSLSAAVAIGAVGVAGAKSNAPSKAVVKQSSSVKIVPNRYIQEGMRFDRDVYNVKSGGTVQFVMSQPQDGPHTFTVVAPRDLPKNAQQALNCKICNELGRAHGADPNSEGPPKFQFLENGVGQNATPPKLDRPGDSGYLPPKKGASISFKVTAKKGTTLTFMCLVHPWMQAKIKVG
jgi:plastocyanin